MTEYIVYHNPRCSKSRQVLQILAEHDITPTVIEYLDNVPTVKELKHIVSLLGIHPRELVRTKEEEFRNATVNLDNDGEVLAYLNKNPRMIERPVIIAGNRAVIGRPPENVLKLLGSIQS